MTTKVINLKGRLQEYGPRLEHAPRNVVYVGRRLTRGGWDLPQHPLYNPFQIDTPKKKHDGTREEVMAKYRDHLMGRPDLLALVPELRGKTLACWCAPELCHGDILAEVADKKVADKKR
ncbi:DUF4326 domain-containing protein [Streptomyces sp. NPDC003753]|uniref:DUF4326 domain-containing protein n=1 Tax=unclassified Streptomyces TaxID=2593676 RepID=UPI0019046B7B|nr:DUF4326 domain-containing protein [Streptomyces sp. Y2F8-2]GHK04116.1 hypothetical protein SY2F82_59130 [Streptomyces sp. Y2F8-2]